MDILITIRAHYKNDAIVMKTSVMVLSTMRDFLLS